MIWAESPSKAFEARRLWHGIIADRLGPGLLSVVGNTCLSRQPRQLGQTLRFAWGDDLGRRALSRLSSCSGLFEAAPCLWHGIIADRLGPGLLSVVGNTCLSRQPRQLGQTLRFAWGDDLGRRALSRLSSCSGLFEAAPRLWYGK